MSLDPVAFSGPDAVLMADEKLVWQEIKDAETTVFTARGPNASNIGKGDPLFAGARLKVKLTSLRVLFILPAQPRPVGLALALSPGKVEIREAPAKTGLVGIFSMAAQTSVQLVCVSDGAVISVVFSSARVKDEFLRCGLHVLREKSTVPAKEIIQKESSSIPVVGIRGLQLQQQELLKKSAEITQDASKDLEHLMAHAQDVVRIVDKFAHYLQSSVLDADDKSCAVLGGIEKQIDERMEIEAILQSIGMVSPVTKLSAGRNYHEELANQLAALFQADNRLTRLGGMVTLTNAYCLFNRARGTELVSPDDLYTAATLLKESLHSMHLRKFNSGVYVIQSASLNDADIKRCLVHLCSGGDRDDKPCTDVVQGKLATEIAVALGISLSLCKEQLAMAEQHGALCRDESIIGVRFFPNTFFK